MELKVIIFPVVLSISLILKNKWSSSTFLHYLIMIYFVFQRGISLWYICISLFELLFTLELLLALVNHLSQMLNISLAKLTQRLDLNYWSGIPAVYRPSSGHWIKKEMYISILKIRKMVMLSLESKVPSTPPFSWQCNFSLKVLMLLISVSSDCSWESHKILSQVTWQSSGGENCF